MELVAEQRGGVVEAHGCLADHEERSVGRRNADAVADVARRGVGFEGGMDFPGEHEQRPGLRGKDDALAELGISEDSSTRAPLSVTTKTPLGLRKKLPRPSAVLSGTACRPSET